MSRLLVALPTYQERDNLEPMLDALLGLQLDEALCSELGVLVIDDDSPDGTGAIAARYAERDPRVSLLSRARKEGLGRAYQAGLKRALAEGWDWVATMDADFSHDPGALGDLLAATERADLVLGSRYVFGGGTRNWGLSRQALSRCGSLYARRVLGVAQRDLTGGFRLYRRGLLERVPLATLHAGGYGFQIEMLLHSIRAGARVVEVPILFEERRLGRSKLGWRDVVEAAILPWQLRR